MKKLISRVMVGIVIALPLHTPCFPSTPTGHEPAPQNRPYEWKTSTPAEQGLNPDILSKALDEAREKSYYYSLLIVRNGYLVAEEYYLDEDKNTRAFTFSVTKSYISALVGIAIQKGYIDSVDQKLLDFFPEYVNEDTDPRKFNITIRHLITMRAGFDHERNIGRTMMQAENLIAAIIASKLRFDPGAYFLYSTHGVHLLSAILTKATGMSTLAFAKKVLFEPMGAESVDWLTDQNGIFLGGAGMFLTPRDMARFGYLYLKNGMLDGQQIIPSGWIKESVTNHRDYVQDWKEMNDVGYGYLWWTGRLNQHSIYFASGIGGQWILVIPDLDMVVVATMNEATEKGNEQMESFISIVYHHILPAVSTD